jgi:hypothetical protein
MSEQWDVIIDKLNYYASNCLMQLIHGNHAHASPSCCNLYFCILPFHIAEANMNKPLGCMSNQIVERDHVVKVLYSYHLVF